MKGGYEQPVSMENYAVSTLPQRHRLRTQLLRGQKPQNSLPNGILHHSETKINRRRLYGEKQDRTRIPKSVEVYGLPINKGHRKGEEPKEHSGRGSRPYYHLLVGSLFHALVGAKLQGKEKTLGSKYYKVIQAFRPDLFSQMVKGSQMLSDLWQPIAGYIHHDFDEVYLSPSKEVHEAFHKLRHLNARKKISREALVKTVTEKKVSRLSRRHIQSAEAHKALQSLTFGMYREEMNAKGEITGHIEMHFGRADYMRMHYKKLDEKDKKNGAENRKKNRENEKLLKMLKKLLRGPVFGKRLILTPEAMEKVIKKPYEKEYLTGKEIWGKVAEKIYHREWLVQIGELKIRTKESKKEYIQRMERVYREDKSQEAENSFNELQKINAKLVNLQMGIKNRRQKGLPLYESTIKEELRLLQRKNRLEADWIKYQNIMQRLTALSTDISQHGINGNHNGHTHMNGNRNVASAGLVPFDVSQQHNTANHNGNGHTLKPIDTDVQVHAANNGVHSNGLDRIYLPQGVQNSADALFQLLTLLTPEDLAYEEEFRTNRLRSRIENDVKDVAKSFFQVLMYARPDLYTIETIEKMIREDIVQFIGLGVDFPIEPYDWDRRKLPRLFDLLSPEISFTAEEKENKRMQAIRRNRSVTPMGNIVQVVNLRSSELELYDFCRTIIDEKPVISPRQEKELTFV